MYPPCCFHLIRHASIHFPFYIFGDSILCEISSPWILILKYILKRKKERIRESCGLSQCAASPSSLYKLFIFGPVSLIKCTLEKQTWTSFTSYLGFLSSHRFLLPSIASSSHPAKSSFDVCILSNFVCSLLILHAASAHLPLPSGILSGNQTSYCTSMDWRSV